MILYRSVGDVDHQKFWLPAEETEEFNGHIWGKIEIIKKFGREE